jgi:hypothetical protein
MKTIRKFDVGDQVVHKRKGNQHYIYEIIPPRYKKMLITIREVNDIGYGTTELASEFRLATKKEILHSKIKNIFKK